MLNQDLNITTQPASVRRAFVGAVRRVLLFAGHELYKFTEYPLFKGDGSVTPWWSSVEPVDEDDAGLAKSLSRAQGLSVSAADFTRARTAVSMNWNQMSNLLCATLLQPVYALVGTCAHQAIDPNNPTVVFIGGSRQFYIPNLTAQHIRQNV